MADNPTQIEKLFDSLHQQFGESLHSCVDSFPSSKKIHYLRDDLDKTAAEGRLVRIEELYQAERLASTPISKDPGLGTLDTSIHLFGDVFVIHLICPGGRVIGFSLEAEGLSELHTSVTEWLDTMVETEHSTTDTEWFSPVTFRQFWLRIWALYLARQSKQYQNLVGT